MNIRLVTRIYTRFETIIRNRFTEILKYEAFSQFRQHLENICLEYKLDLVHSNITLNNSVMHC